MLNTTLSKLIGMRYLGLIDDDYVVSKNYGVKYKDLISFSSILRSSDSEIDRNLSGTIVLYDINDDQYFHNYIIMPIDDTNLKISCIKKGNIPIEFKINREEFFDRFVKINTGTLNLRLINLIKKMNEEMDRMIDESKKSINKTDW